MTVTGGSNKRVSLAALIAIKPGQHPRLIYRVHKSRRRGKDQRKGFTEADYAQLLDAAHQQLAGPLVVEWDNLDEGAEPPAPWRMLEVASVRLHQTREAPMETAYDGRRSWAWTCTAAAACWCG